MTYDEIAEKTGASSTTISRVKKVFTFMVLMGIKSFKKECLKKKK